MNSADSISIFAEGTFNEQIRELVTYLARSRSEEEQTTFIAPFQEALAVKEGEKPVEEDETKKRTVVGNVLDAITAVGEGSPREIEGFFNLVFAHFVTLFDLESPDTRTRLDKLLNTVASSTTDPSTKYRILGNFFNALPRRSALRLPAYKSLLSVASANDELKSLGITPEIVDQWLAEWPISTEEKSALLSSLEAAFTKAEDLDTAYEFTLAYVRSLPSGSSDAQTAAVKAIATALQHPAQFNFEPLLKLEAVSAISSHPVHALLQIFLGGGFKEYQAWTSSNESTISELSLDTTALERKIKLLTMSSLAFDNVGQNLPYSSIASALQIEESEVERWAIDAVRAGLVGGRLSQTHRTLHISRATPRSFGDSQWNLLEQRLLAWQTGLASVMDVILATQTSGRPAAVANAKEATAA